MMVNDVVGLVRIRLDIYCASRMFFFSYSTNSFQGLVGFYKYLLMHNQNKSFDTQSKNTLSVFIHEKWFCSLLT